jgi:outer membrane receptor for ferrienterochelin and colicins
VFLQVAFNLNLFTEEHAATGSREVIVLEELKPERSYNANLNYLKKMYITLIMDSK